MALDYRRATRTLSRRDPVLGRIIRAWGACGLAETPVRDGFTALVRVITFQQLSTAAARTIYGRLTRLLPRGGDPTPAALAALSDEALRAAGYSRQKLASLRDLCRQAAGGAVELSDLATLDDEAVIRALTRIRGIGRWSAEMVLIFTLKRPDVFPVDDLGIVKAIRRAYGLRRSPTANRLLKIADPWRPYRSVACWYLWRSLDTVRQPGSLEARGPDI